MKKDKVNVEELNNVISTGSRILKIAYIFMIMALIAAVVFILRELNVFSIIFTILRVISPFFIGFILAWLVNPLINKFTDKGMKRGLAVSLVYLLVAVVLYLFCLAVIPSLINQLNDFAKTIPTYIDQAGEFINNIFNKLGDSTKIDMTDAKVNFLTYIENFGKNIANDLPTTLINVIQNVISGIGSFLIAIMIAFYLSLNFNNVNKVIMNMIPKKFRLETSYLFSNISDVLYRFVNGTLWMSVLLFIIHVIAFSLIGLNSPVLFSLFCAVTNLIPYVGPYIGAVPAILVGFSQSSVIGVLTLIFIVVFQTIEGNIIHPIVIGKQTDLHPITIIISLLVFEYFFGILGMVIATPIMAVLKIIYVFFDEKYDFFGYAKDTNVKKEISKVKLK